ncbi:MAG TPA: phage tail protein [Aggregatilinea sp.]|uniref:phage tail protein n=1 Tax=Aggregatilinea sp. TaxID=2806333 RepID=UPI002BAB8518|nr:phage tail protein [Aggregatilinea sp.]HML20401.1 phage tail protein [Aggregatilinea sp.]
MAQQSSGIQAVDSLSANEFKVEIEGAEAAGIFAVRGLTIRQMDGSGQVTLQPVVIVKMVQQDPTLPFNRWTRETLANSSAKVTRELSVVAVDDGVEVRRWVIKDAWISSIALSDFDTAQADLIEERLTIHHGGIEERWPQR